MKIFRTTLLTGIIFCSGLTLRAQIQSVNGVKAVVHDSPVTYFQVESSTASAADALRREYATEPAVFQQKIGEALNASLDQLIDRQLILHEFETAGYNLPESVIDEIVDDRIREEYGDRASWTKSVAGKGISYEKFRRQVRDQFIIQQMRLKNVSSEIMVSPHKIELYYAEHKAEYHVEDEVKLRMIVLNKPVGGDAAQVKKLAEEVLSKIKSGASFAEMASQFSQGSQRRQGGDWGWVERSTLLRGLSDVAFSLDAGQLSDLLGRTGTGNDYWLCHYNDTGQLTLASHYALDQASKKETLVEERQFSNSTNSTVSIPEPEEFYLMYVEDKKPAHFKPLSEMRDDIERTLLAQERTRLENQWIERLKKKTFVYVFP